MTSDANSWIVCQIGAREHYALATALEQRGLLAALLTDAWRPPSRLSRLLPGPISRRLQSRFALGISPARVSHFTQQFLRFEMANRLAGARQGWDRTIARNTLFQSAAAARLRDGHLLEHGQGGTPVVFAYSYAALEIFRAARRAGAVTVLGQIDGGAADERHVETVLRERGAPEPPRPPARYWANWREECALADHIVVNSDWSRRLLVSAGVAARKIAVVPLMYEPDAASEPAPRHYPDHFGKARPLQVLYLGALSARKGVHEVLGAASLLAAAPVEFQFVGEDAGGLSQRVPAAPNVRWSPAVPRGETSAWYRRADVFLFPSHSDGFGLTQIEALGHGLPVIASEQCGAAVEHGVSGLILAAVTAADIAAALQRFLDQPEFLARLARNTLAAAQRFRPDRVVPMLLALTQAVGADQRAGVAV